MFEKEIQVIDFEQVASKLATTVLLLPGRTNVKSYIDEELKTAIIKALKTAWDDGYTTGTIEARQ